MGWLEKAVVGEIIGELPGAQRGMARGTIRDIFGGASGEGVVRGVANRVLTGEAREIDNPALRRVAQSTLNAERVDRIQEQRAQEARERIEERDHERDVVQARYGRGPLANRDILPPARQDDIVIIPEDQNVTIIPEADPVAGTTVAARDQDVTIIPVPDTPPAAQPISAEPQVVIQPEPVADTTAHVVSDRTIAIARDRTADRPADAAPEVETSPYTVRAGQSWTDIINDKFPENNFTQDQRERLVDHMVHLNGITNPNLIQAGRELELPDSPVVPDNVPRLDWEGIKAEYRQNRAASAEVSTDAGAETPSGARLPVALDSSIQGQTFGGFNNRFDI